MLSKEAARALLQSMCERKGVGTSGSCDVLMKRFLNPNAHLKKPGKKPAGKRPGKRPGKRTDKPEKPLFKVVKGGGQRLSAASYFKGVAHGKLKNCEPQWILQPNGESVLKKIKICKDAWGGQCAKWVTA